MSGEGKIKLEAALVLAAKEAHIDHLKQELKYDSVTNQLSSTNNSHFCR